VERKLSKALSVEYTINELIAEATDITNLATVYFGEYNFLIDLTVCLTLSKGGEPTTDIGSCTLYL
jgi:FATC domain